MSQYLAGFLTATLVWAAALVAYVKGYIDLDFLLTDASESSEEVSSSAADDANESKKSRKTRRRRPSKRRSRRHYRTVLTGDSLNENETRDIDMVGFTGEQQLTTLEIEDGIDSVFGRIKRCLLLVDENYPINGKVIFGMRITGEGKVTKVNLKGPIPIVKGEAGGCIRRTLKGIQYRSFDGPPMVVHYPLKVN